MEVPISRRGSRRSPEGYLDAIRTRSGRGPDVTRRCGLRKSGCCEMASSISVAVVSRWGAGWLGGGFGGETSACEVRLPAGIWLAVGGGGRAGVAFLKWFLFERCRWRVPSWAFWWFWRGAFAKGGRR